ncbi:hypothetical protein NW762_003253 [Fusarium torreyae]|uniref:Uncharacterized protein n=1 Tax=Fusarium torreyae TaxID=1237075 RepID=A0A9W8VHI9_9HYPO|nr:hypothetical protein NW762_003253 [Fusarium torreyae]
MGPAPTAQMTPSRPHSSGDRVGDCTTHGEGSPNNSHSQHRATPRPTSSLSLLQTPGPLSREITDLIAKIDRNEVIDRRDMDNLLRPFRNDFLRDGVELLTANFFDITLPHFNPGKSASKCFVTPIYHERNGGHWSIIYSSRKVGDSSIKVRHYDPIYNESRHRQVREKIKGWVEVALPHLQFDYEREYGPRINPRAGNSAVYVVMAAREFARLRKIVPNLVTWDDPDPKVLIKKALRETYREEFGSPSNPYSVPSSPDDDSSGDNAGDTTNLTTPAATPTPRGPTKRKPALSKSAQKNIPTCQKQGKLHRNGGIFSATPVEDGRRQTMPPSSPLVETPSGKRATTGSIPDEISEPNSKRRRTGLDQPLSFSVEETMKEYTSFSESLALPSIQSLWQERKKCEQALHEEDQGLQSKKKELEVCDKVYAERTKTCNDFKQYCDDMKDKVNADERKISDFFANLSLPKLDTVPEDALQSDLQNTKAAMHNNLTPAKATLKDNLDRKRKADEMCRSAGEVCNTRKKELDEARTTRDEAESALKKSCQREEVAAVMSEFDRKMRAIQTELEREDWYEAFCERRAAE